MTTVSLAEVSDLIDYGVTASANPEPVGPKFLRITDIQDGDVDWGAVPYCDADERKLRSSRLRPGDIVFARTGATTGKSYLIRECPDNAVFASYLIRVRPSPRIDPRFLAHFFNSAGYWEQISLKAAGAAQPGVNASKLEELILPLPPIDEQRRIAAILDQADALRAKRRAALAQLDEMARAIFVEMFGPGPYQRTIPIGDCVEEFRYGTSNKSGLGGYPTLRIPNVLGSAINLTDLKTVEVEEREFSRLRLREGDLLFVRTNGNPDYVGRCAVVPAKLGHDIGLSAEDFIFASYLIRARPTPGAVHPTFVQVFLSIAEGRHQVREHAKTSAGQFNINTEGLAALRIPQVPYSEQAAYADRIAAIAVLRSSLEQHSATSDDLFTSLQHRAFRGEL